MKPNLSPSELLRRYLAAIPGCSEGEGRDALVFRTACNIIERFDLPEDELCDALVAWDAEVNLPPVGERLVREKFLSALRRTQYDPAKANSRVPRLDRRQATRRPNLREVEPKEPAAPLPTEESFERMRDTFLTSDKPVAVEAREWLVSLGIDPADCGWAASTLTYADAKDRGFGHDAAQAITGVRFLVPIRDPLTGALLDVRRIATGPFARDDIDGRFKALPWAAGHGQARVYRWDDLATRTAELVWCEGEKDCEVLRAHGFIAISNSCGCGGWRAAAERIPDELVAGKRFILVPDADKAGRDTAPKVADELLARGVAEVRIMWWSDDSPAGFDATDFFTGGGTAPELQAMLDMAETHVPARVPSTQYNADRWDCLADWGPYIDTELSCVDRGGLRELRMRLTTQLADWAIGRDILVWDPNAKGVYLIDRGRVVLVNPRPDMPLRASLMQVGVNPSEDTFKWLVHGLEAAAFERGKHLAISRFVHHAIDDNGVSVYVSCGPRHLVKARTTAAGTCVEKLPNGADDVWFAEDAQFPAWEVSELVDPLDLVSLNCPIDEGAQVRYETWMQRRLLRLWLVAAIGAIRPLWLLSLLGSKGSGKSTVCKTVARLFDPSSDATSLPDDVRDYETAITSQAIYPIDNLDAKADDLPKWLPDRLATTVTGGQVRRRALYTNGEAYLARISACVAISSRTAAYTRPDLTERSLAILTREFDDADRLPEEDLWTDLAAKRDGVLSWLAHRASQVIFHRTKAPRGLPSRFLDVARLLWADMWLDGCEERVVPTLEAMRRGQALMMQGGNDLLDAILDETRDGYVLRGTPKEIVTELERAGHNLPYFGHWRNAGAALRELRTVLESLGYHVTESSHGNSVMLTYRPPTEDETGAAAQSQEPPDDPDDDPFAKP